MEELCSLTASKLQQMQTMKEVKGGNTAQNSNFMLARVMQRRLLFQSVLQWPLSFAHKYRDANTFQSPLNIQLTPCILCAAVLLQSIFQLHSTWLCSGGSAEFNSWQCLQGASTALFTEMPFSVSALHPHHLTNNKKKKKAEDTRCFVVLVTNYQRTWQAHNSWGYQERFEELNKQRLRINEIQKK